MNRLADMTWPDVAAAVAAGATTVILPLGATEQHGPHLPLGTDTFRAAALADRLAARLPEALVAPPLPIGCSDEHAGFPGLLSLDAETLASVIVDCAGRMVAWGARRLILLSAHGGNGRALERAAARLTRELPDLRVWLPNDLLVVADAALEVGGGGDVPPEAVGLHAGEVALHRAGAGGVQHHQIPVGNRTVDRVGRQGIRRPHRLMRAPTGSVALGPKPATHVPPSSLLAIVGSLQASAWRAAARSSLRGRSSAGEAREGFWRLLTAAMSAHRGLRRGVAAR